MEYSEQVEPIPSQPPEFEFGQFVKHNRLDFPPGQICQIQWRPGKQGCHSKGFYIYLVRSFPDRFWVLGVDISLAEGEMMERGIELQNTICHINAEMERVGWSNTEGRNHLIKTYGKRSRFQLTDDQLLEFLNYLKSLPSQ